MSEDVAAIRTVLARQFASLNWTPGTDADWPSFQDDFFPDASLYPAARPARRQTVAAFVERMKGLRGSTLQSFAEVMLGSEIQVFGNVAVAMAAAELTENGTRKSRAVEALLLVKDAGEWRIVSQAWDTASEQNPVPESLLK